MGKSFFIVPFLAAALASCSSDEPVTNGGDNGSIDTNFISVNLVATPTVNNSRAVEDDENYEDGVDKESTVSKVRFYFFKANGDAANVKGGSNPVNYMDITPNVEPGDPKPNVDKQINAVLAIETPKGDGLPETIVAILNPTQGLLDKGSVSFSTLNSEIENYNKGAFVMANAVYAGNAAAKMDVVNIVGNIKNSREDALKYPATIYVERVLAKVRLETKFADNNKIPAGEGDSWPEFDGKKLYVKFLGWNATATTDKSRLIKDINPEWEADLFGAAEPWNYAPFFRCFWAINPSGLEYVYGPFQPTENAVNVANAITSFKSGEEVKNYTYIQENASDDLTGSNPTTPTQVIIAAQLVDESGSPVEMADYGGQKYSIASLKTAMLANTSIFKKTLENGKAKFTQIKEADINFKTATTVGEASKDKEGRYYVFAQLTKANEDATDVKWTTSENDNAAELTVSDVNTLLKQIGHAKIWTNGYTYYYFDIRHLNPTEGGAGYVGVVRNHVYNATIKTLAGLGTPVYDPTEVIYPEKPKNEDSFVAVELKIQTWRLVKQNVDLNWN